MECMASRRCRGLYRHPSACLSCSTCRGPACPCQACSGRQWTGCCSPMVADPYTVTARKRVIKKTIRSRMIIPPLSHFLLTLPQARCFCKRFDITEITEGNYPLLRGGRNCCEDAAQVIKNRSALDLNARAIRFPRQKSVRAMNPATLTCKFVDKRTSYCNGAETCSWTISHLPS